MALFGEKTRLAQTIRLLIERAESQGYLARQDILNSFPAVQSEEPKIARIIALLTSEGIEIFDEDPSVESSTASARNPDEISTNEMLVNDDAVSLYLHEMSVTPLLSLEEERSLAIRIDRSEQARHDLARPNGYDPISRQEFEIMIQDGRLAREALIKANTRLVVSIARRYVGHGVPFLDLIQEGNLGLMKAVEKFEYRRGFRFSTYATWWVRQGIFRAIADQGRTIRVPVHMVDRLRQIYKASQAMEQQLGRPPTSQELAIHLDLDGTKLRWIMQVSQPTLSLETPVGDEEDGELGMYVEDEHSPSPAQVVYENMLRERVDEVLSTLTPREARVIRLRFGLGQDRPYTLEEVGKKFGLTRERIRQIEGKALRRLRQPSRARLLRELP